MENSAWKDVITRLLVAYEGLDRMFTGEDSISALDIENTPARQHYCGLYKNICDAKASILKILSASGAVDELLKKMSDVDKVYGLVGKYKDAKKNTKVPDNNESLNTYVKSYSFSNIADKLLSDFNVKIKADAEAVKAFRKFFDEIEKNNDKNKGDEKDKKD